MIENFAKLAMSCTPQVMSPSSPTRPLLWTVTRRPSTIRTTITSLTFRKPHSRILDCSMFPQCVKPLFCTVLIGDSVHQRESKESTSEETVGRQRERERKNVNVLWWVLQIRCQGKVDWTVLGVILFRLTENFILMNEISENTLNGELNKRLLVTIHFREH